MRAAVWAALLLPCLVACDAKPAETYSARRERVLGELARDAATPALDALVAAARAFADSLGAEPSAEAQGVAQGRWRDLREAWRRCAPWLIAGVGDGLYEERLDAEPDFERLAAIEAGGPVFDADAVAALGWSQKSLLAQGYLVFAPAPLSPRAWSLLQHASRQWADEADALAGVWSGPEGIGQALANPTARSTFRDAKDAVDALLRRLVLVVARLRDDDVAALAGATRKGAPATFDPRFDRAQHHRSELLATLEGLAVVYLGRADDPPADPPTGLSALVAKKSARVDASFRAALVSARRAAEALPDDVVRVAREDPSVGAPLYDFVTLLRAQLTTSIASQLDTSLGFTLADGD